MNDTTGNIINNGPEQTNTDTPSIAGGAQDPFSSSGNIPEWHPHIKIYLMAIVAAVVIISLLVFVLNLGHLYTTTSTTAPTKSFTTTVNNVKPHVNIIGLNLLESPKNALYGIPNSSDMHVYNVTVCQNCLVTTYGLNFTEPIISSNTIASPLEKLAVPAAYNTIKTPIILLFDAAYYNDTNTTNSTYSYIYNTMRSNPDFLNMSLKNITITNTHATEFSFKAYGLQTYAVSYRYYNYLILVMTYGNIGFINDSYAIAIANHTLGMIST
jgi:hypothetical protein